jgi:hypothetical protein
MEISLSKFTHMLKLSVGTESPETLEEWQRSPRVHTPDGLPRHVTRMWPKRAEEILNGGSIFWVIKGVILCRQRILRLDEVIREDGIRRCAIVHDPKLIRVEATPKRAFQGWRYFAPEDAPRDLAEARQGEAEIPAELSAALADIGVR